MTFFYYFAKTDRLQIGSREFGNNILFDDQLQARLHVKIGVIVQHLRHLAASRVPNSELVIRDSSSLSLSTNASGFESRKAATLQSAALDSCRAGTSKLESRAATVPSSTSGLMPARYHRSPLL